MQHQGGKKPGRKPGSGNKKKSAVILTREYDSGKIMPLEVQLEAMRLYWADWTERRSRVSERSYDTCSSRWSLLPPAPSGD
jgi:hypothetical protein